MAGNRIRIFGTFVLIFAAVIATGTVWSQQASDADKQFVRWAIETNNAEIAAAHLALG